MIPASRQSNELAFLQLCIEIIHSGDCFVSPLMVARISGCPEKGFYIACQNLKPYTRFVVNAGPEQYPIDANTIAIGVPALAQMLSALTI
jgi:hypothetical protein